MQIGKVLIPDRRCVLILTIPTYIHVPTYNIQNATGVDHIYIISIMVLKKNQITTLKNNQSEIVEGVCDTEIIKKMPP